MTAIGSRKPEKSWMQGLNKEGEESKKLQRIIKNSRKDQVGLVSKDLHILVLYLRNKTE